MGIVGSCPHMILEETLIILQLGHCVWRFLAALHFYSKVWTFWEAHNGFDKSADLLCKRQNHKADFFRLCVLFKKSELYR